MTSTETDSRAEEAHAPKPAALVVRGGAGLILTGDGEIIEADGRTIDQHLAGEGLIACHAPFVWRRMGQRAPQRQSGLFDLVELFAFVHPARFAPPTPLGLAGALGLACGRSAESEAEALLHLTRRLLADAGDAPPPAREAMQGALSLMARGGWSWAQALGSRLGPPKTTDRPRPFEPWRAIPEWEEVPPRGQPGSLPLEPGEARAVLTKMIQIAIETDEREIRSSQGDYAELAGTVFQPRAAEGEPIVAAIEAGTGIGKTLGYLAPALSWSQRNDGAVWVSTFTKNLQRQIAQTTERLLPEEEERRRKIVVNKGRENYLCLLNFQDALAGGLDPVGLGLIARWFSASADGDMIGGDFPSWLTPLISPRRSDATGGAQRLGLTDRRGECIYGACPHYRRCFIENVQRRSEGASLVIANHAKVLTKAASDVALPDGLKSAAPRRLILDEGHHLFDAADSVFAAHLTAGEMADLRRWIRGPEIGNRAGRGRSLADRLSDLIGDDEASADALRTVLREAAGLAAADWSRRLEDGSGGPGLAFLAAVRREVLARAEDARDAFGAECEARPVSAEIASTALALEALLGRLAKALGTLLARLEERFSDEDNPATAEERIRLEGAIRTLTLRARLVLPGWRAILTGLGGDVPEGLVDWLAIERVQGQEVDLGYYRHHLDPAALLARHVYRPAHGVLITSATLLPRPDDPGTDETVPAADRGPPERLGLSHLPRPALLARFPSPFPYAEATRFIVVRDVDIRSAEPLSIAMRVLIEAAGGGTLALFSAVERLKAVHRRIAAPLEAKGLPVYAQHVDELDTGTLIDIFRAETDATLFGTDATRDGVDVPGRSLRLIVMERVPWPRPDILHKARKAAFGGRAYEEEIVRMRIAQAFGRLIRRHDDKGVFVLLGAQTPSRLLEGLPGGVEVVRTGLADAARIVHEFIG